jgi:hypothetical protein
MTKSFAEFTDVLDVVPGSASAVEATGAPREHGVGPAWDAADFIFIYWQRLLYAGFLG